MNIQTNQTIQVVETSSSLPRLTPATMEHPAYFLNNNFELEWCNASADDFLHAASPDVADAISGRNVFGRLLESREWREAEGFSGILAFHAAVAKQRLSKASILSGNGGLGGADLETLSKAFDEAEGLNTRSLISTDVNLACPGETPRWHTLYASFFREGILFNYSPCKDTADEVADLLARRDIVIRDILKNRKPFLTQVAVLVADLEASTRICAELPPDEYFTLINDIWTAMGRILRKYYATHGKHVGDGMVYYFLPQPDSNYLFNAILCADEMRQKMAELSAEWAEKKRWLNDLKLNIGIDEGEEWFGTYQTPTHLEFTVLGDTINRAGRLSDFAQSGTSWVSKTLLSKLSAAERKRVSYGVRYQADGQQTFVANSYARMSTLVDIANPVNRKLADIAGLTVTEVVSVAR